MSPRPAVLRAASGLAGLAALGIVLGGALSPGPAVAAGPSGPELVPLVDCVQDAQLGSVTSRTLILGYRSTAAGDVELQPGGGSNDITGGAAGRGQPASFQPGDHHRVWLLTVDAQAEPSLSWKLGEAVATLDGTAPACSDATVLTLNAPPTVSAGGTATVTATVSRMLLGAPGSGSVEFTVDGEGALVAPLDGEGTARADLPIAAVGTHTVSARYVPVDGSTLLSSTSSAAVTGAPPAAPLSIAADSVVAGSTSAKLTISRASGAGAARVDYSTADGTAVAGLDYAAASGTVTLADGQLSATVSVPLKQRPAGSAGATFFVLLQRSSTGVDPASATVRLPAVALVAAASAPHNAGAAVSGGGGNPPAGPSSSLPLADPTAPVHRGGASASDLLLLFGAGLVTLGGVVGAFGLFRAVAGRGLEA